jgi:hypothetical protein
MDAVPEGHPRGFRRVEVGRSIVEFGRSDVELGFPSLEFVRLLNERGAHRGQCAVAGRRR